MHGVVGVGYFRSCKSSITLTTSTLTTSILLAAANVDSCIFHRYLVTVLGSLLIDPTLTSGVVSVCLCVVFLWNGFKTLTITTTTNNILALRGLSPQYTNHHDNFSEE